MHSYSYLLIPISSYLTVSAFQNPPPTEMDDEDPPSPPSDEDEEDGDLYASPKRFKYEEYEEHVDVGQEEPEPMLLDSSAFFDTGHQQPQPQHQQMVMENGFIGYSHSSSEFDAYFANLSTMDATSTVPTCSPVEDAEYAVPETCPSYTELLSRQ